MDLSPFEPTCQACGGLLGFDASFCLLCSRLLCARHLVVRKGVAVCEDCQAERSRLESTGPISDADEERMVTRVARDLETTMGAGLGHIAVAEAARVRLFASALADYEQKVVDDVQQRVHDEHLNTTWPTCPAHPNHPLWYSDGWWRCEKVGAVAKLGELASQQWRGNE